MLWSIIVILHSIFIFHYFSGNIWRLAMLDGTIFNFTFALMGIGIWYAVAYNNFENRNFFSIILINLVIGIVFVAAWFWISFTLLKMILPEDAIYLPLVKATTTWRLLIGFFYYVILVLIFYTNINYQSLQVRKANEAEMQNLINQAELSNLKAQLNPHFIFNSLNSISALTVSQPRQAREMIIKLSEFLRYSLRQENKEQLVTLQEELANIDKYLAIEKIRFGDRLQIDKAITVAPENFRIPIFILQPLFENAIKHGVYESIEPVIIQINISLDQDWLLIKVNNNYDPEAIIRKGAGIGLPNIRNRLKLIYGNPDLLTVSKKDNIFIVELVIPQL
jgi:sensor histidine kinase YesM